MRESFLGFMARRKSTSDVVRAQLLRPQRMRPRMLDIHGVKPRIRTVAEHVEQWLDKIYPHWRLTMDGAFYLDTRAPFPSGSIPAVTLATTNKALYRVADFPNLGGNYFSFIGKKICIRLYGQITTGTTPGNGQFVVLWGTGADANGVTLASSAADTLIASQTNLSWDLEIYIRCVTLGSAGTLICTGGGLYNASVVAAHHARIPPSAPAPSAAVDLTANNIVSVQYNRSGSTAETMQVVDMEVVAMN